jgi:pyruvate dehydrogenase E2 component (dihydrolipoamide acetyltransferase)
VSLQPVIMPKLGVYMEDVLLSEWLAPEGAKVRAGQVLFVLENDKTEAEVEAEVEGWLHHTVEAGAKVAIGSEVGVVTTTREEYDALRSEQARAAGDGEAETRPFLGYVETGGGAAVAGLSPPEVVHVERPARASRSGGPSKVSPRARALLASRGIPLEQAAEIVGSGAEGRITDKDVAAYLEGREAQSGDPAIVGTVALRGRRGVIARRMVTSLHEAAQLTSVVELEVGPVVRLRETMNEAGAGPRIGYTAIFIKLVAGALCSHPLLNSRVAGDEIELLADVNVAVAVDTEEGLIAPVVRRADRLSIEEINVRVSDLATRARAGSLGPDDVAGGTFTLSNGGIHPVDITTAILNPPQTALLWIGRIRDRPVVRDGEVVVRPTLQACLTYDHRAIDGGPAAAFLGTLEALIRDLPDLRT